MKRIVTKVLASLMCVALILAMTPLSGLIGLSLSINSFALESGDSCGDSATYTFDSSTGLLVISGSGEIKERAFWNKESIKKVIINSGITSINRNAFFLCKNLTDVIIPDSVASIGDAAFEYCYGLISVTIPDSVTEIGNNAFHYVNNVSYTSKMKATGSPWGAKCVNGYVEGNLVYNNSKKGMLCGCSAIATGIVSIQESVSEIGDGAFYGCKSITNVIIPDGVESIGSSAFYDCDGLTDIVIPNSVKSIGSRVFENCDGLAKVIISNGITNISKSAFCGCVALTDITISDSVTVIEDYAFWGCRGITSITIPDSVTSVSSNAFQFVNNVAYTNSMKATGSPWSAKIANGYVDGSIVYNDSSKSAIYGCSSATTGNIAIADTVKSIEASAFYGCDKITSVTLSNSVTNIGSFAFYCCTALKNVMFGNQLISIGNHAFFACDSITEITIPNSVKSIGLNTFNLCTGLINITISDGVKEIGNNAFGYVNNISYTSNMKATGSPWGAKCVNGYTDGYLVYGNAEKTSIYGCSTTVTESITLPKTVTSIEKNAFYKCDNFTSIALPDSLTNIGEYAFYYCRKLTEITIPSNVAIISENAFMACHGLKSLRISEGMTEIKKSAFSYCMNLEEIFYSGTEEQWKQIVIDDDNEYLVNAKIHYLADIIYKISYNANGGTVQPLSDNVSPLKPVTLPTPTKMYTVSYNANGGVGAPDSQNIYVPCKGWSKNSEATDAEYACGGSFTTAGDITLYAVWDNDVTTTVTSVSSTRLGYTFCGWSTNSKATSADVTAGSNLSVSKNITLYAVWKPVMCEITFDANGGVCDKMTDSVKYGSNVTLPVPTKSDCEFLGWYTKSMGGDRITDLTPITVDMTLFAHWYSRYKLKVDSDETTAGGVAEIPVRIYNNSGLKGFSTTISYDSTALTPIEVKKGAAFNAGSIVSNLEKLTPGELNVVGYSARTSTENDVLYTVVFKVSDGAKGSYALKISYDSDNTYDGDMEDITAQCEDGLIDVMQSSSAKTLLYVENQTVICGDKVNIPIKIKYQNGLESISFNLKYDNTVLDFVSVSSDVAEVSCTSNNGSATINVTSLKECSDEKVIAYVSMKTKAVAQAVITMTSNDDINLLNGVVTVKDDLSVKPTIYSDNAIGKINTTVAVPICIKNNPGLAGYKIKISFDPTALSPESIKDGEFYQGEYNNLGFKSGEIAVIWINIHGTDIQENGEIFTVNFKVLKEGVHNVSVTYSKADTFDEKSEELELICNSGKIFACDLLLPKKDKNTVVDNSNKFVYGLDAGLKTITSYAYVGDGFTISETAGKLGFGTSSKIDVMYEKDVAATYTIVLFGDVNGDGWYDGRDAVTVSMIANGMLSREQVGEAVWMAADCNHDGKIDQADVDLLNQAGLLLSSVDQTKPTEELLKTSSEYNEYLNLIDQSVEVKSDEPEQERPETQKPSLLEFLLTTIWNYIKLILSLIK